MDYDKKVLVLKQINGGFSTTEKPVSAIARVECENGVGDFFLSVINLAPVSEAQYFAYFCDGQKRIFEFNLGVRPLSFHAQFPYPPSVEKGFAVGVYFVKDYLPTPVCLGFSQGCGVDKTSLNKLVAEKCLACYKSPPKEQPKDSEIALSVPPILYTPAEYDDEAVATENYYEKEDILPTDEQIIQEFSREHLSYKNEFIDSPNQEKTFQGTQGFSGREDETFADYFQSREKDFFSTVREELQDLFDKFESEIDLCNRFPFSKWAKITYSKDKFYVVGVVKENGYPKYVCYGVPDDNPTTPPRQLQGFCSFVKLFPDSSEKRGYWMMFQDAKTGKCIHLEE